MNSYVSGSLVRTIATFTNVSGTLTSPGTVVLKYQAGNGSVQTPSTVNDSTGVFHYDIDTTGWTGPGTELYVIQWKGTGTVQAISTDSFEVVSSAF